MAGGGGAQAIKVSDVFILVGISILAAGFIMHAWVSPDEYEIEGEEPVVIEKNVLLMKNDRLEFKINSESLDLLTVSVYSHGEVYQLIPTNIEEQFSSNYRPQYEFKAEESGNYFVTAQITGDSNSTGEVIIDVQRSLMFDFIVYPIGALMLSFGIYKRKEEKSIEAIDAEIS